MGAIAKRLFDKYYANANDLLASIINSIDKLDNKIEYVESHGSGKPGKDATVSVGTTTTGEAGTDASVTNSGTSSDAVLNFTIPRGADGAPGADGRDGTDGQDGASATVSVGTTTTGAAGTDASVTNSGTPSDAVLNFAIPRGADGQDGADGADGQAATIAVGTVTTGEPGTNASVTNSGTSSAAVFDFVIPRGADGSTANLEWTFVDSFNATSKNISIGDCKELLFVAHVSNSAMKVSSVFPIAEITGSTWYKLGGAYRTSSTNSDVEMECVSVSGSGSSFAATFSMSAAYVNGGNVSSSSFVNVYKRG